MVIRSVPGLARGCAGLRASVAKALFLSDLRRFFIRNEYRSKGQRPDLTPIITKHRDRFGHIDFGLRIADLFFLI